MGPWARVVSMRRRPQRERSRLNASNGLGSAGTERSTRPTSSRHKPAVYSVQLVRVSPRSSLR
eukprot:1118686-Pyramimonas_sp.AAC.1